MDPDAGKKQKGDDLEVTGVSRSGRVRKKSSKLMDFESPDDIDTSRPKRISQLHQPRLHSSQITQSQLSPQNNQTKEDPNDELSEEDFYDPTLENPNDSMDSDSDDGGPPDDTHLPLDSSGGGAGHTLSKPANSIYMMEKSNKKKLLVKDGRIVGRAKAQRKDKGKTRVTAYMMWAKSARNDLLKKHPDMDFAAVSKRLGEMWANVNHLERYVWKRRAKRYAASKTDQTPNKILSSPLSTPKVSNISHSNQNSQGQTASTAQHAAHNSRSKQSSHTKHNSNTSGSVVVSGTVNNSGGSSGGGSSSGGMYRVVGVGPVEVGAHLRLLGESLTIIGERLKEHEGQIAVSGSVSVLLDTLLCSLAPLVCLTAHIPSIAPPVPLLQETLDNIAYIMPGL